MNNFSFYQPSMLQEAIDEKTVNNAIVAGGTNLIDLMKENDEGEYCEAKKTDRHKSY